MIRLRLSLKAKWFEMTKSGIKTEDYREINQYWIKRLIEKQYDEVDETEFTSSMLSINQENANEILEHESPKFKQFSENVMTLGYPSANDTEKHQVYKHAGIEIRTGNPEWGAEPNKMYFVIKHGDKQ